MLDRPRASIDLDVGLFAMTTGERRQAGRSHGIRTVGRRLTAGSVLGGRRSKGWRVGHAHQFGPVPSRDASAPGVSWTRLCTTLDGIFAHAMLVAGRHIHLSRSAPRLRLLWWRAARATRLETQGREQTRLHPHMVARLTQACRRLGSWHARLLPSFQRSEGDDTARTVYDFGTGLTRGVKDDASTAGRWHRPMVGEGPSPQY